MKKIVLGLMISLITSPVFAAQEAVNQQDPTPNLNTSKSAPWNHKVLHYIASDYKNFYNGHTMLRLGAGFAVGAIMANTA